MDDDRETEITWYLDADDMHEQSQSVDWEHGKGFAHMGEDRAVCVDDE